MLTIVKWEAYEKQIFTARRSCYACAVRCKREVAIDGQVSEYGGPEYETVGVFGPDCGINDLHAIARANELCNAYHARYHFHRCHDCICHGMF